MDWEKDDGIFLPMLNDVGRFNFYEAAIASVAKDKTFVDAGAGSGLLSYLAVKHGATKVYAVERDPSRYLLLCRILKKLNIDHIVEAIHADFLRTNLSADYCVTETIGSNIFDENIIAITAHAKSCGMKTIPDAIDLQVLVHDAHAIFFLSLKDHTHVNLRLRDKFGNFGDALSTFIHIKNSKPLEINEFFPVSESLPEIKLETIYTSDPITITMGTLVDDITLVVPKQYTPYHAVANVIWKARFNNIEMDVRKTNWGVPAKRVIRPNEEMILKYIHPNWWYIG